MPTLRHRTELSHPRPEVYRWHTRPGAFERLAPPWVRLRVHERTGGLEPGSRVRLGIGRGPVELSWEVEHSELEENRRFVDEQVSGPFRTWRHEHRFEKLPDGGSAVVDEVAWEAPLGSLGDALSESYIQGELERMLAFRARRLQGDLDLHARYGGEPLRIAISGSTGLIGGALSDFLRSGGHEVLPLVRGRGSDEGTIRWDPASGQIDAEALEGVDAVVHLAGEPIQGLRWTAAKKEEILRSRVEGTALLARALAGLTRPPRVFVAASAVGYYGDRGDERLSERSGSGEGFLADVCRRWEGAARPARDAGIRTVHLRSGVVLTPLGGVLGTVRLPFRLGVGGRLGSGRQYMSWIDLDDQVGLILHALRRDEVTGAMNATAPAPVANAAFTDILGRVLSRPTILPAPRFGIKAILGQMGSELLLMGQRALPEKAEKTGYRFLYPDLEASLRHQLGRGNPDA